MLAACGGQEASSPGGATSDGGVESSADGPAHDDAADSAIDAPEEAAQNQAPKAAFEVSSEFGVAPLQASFDGSGSSDTDGVIASYAWDFGDGGKGVGKEAQHSYAAAGCYVARLTVTDDGGLSGVEEKTLVVTVAAPAGAPAVELGELPRDMAVIPRDTTTKAGVVRVSGTVKSPGYHAVVAEWIEGGAVVSSQKAPLCGADAELPFEIELALPSDLVSRDLRVSVVEGTTPTQIAAVKDLVAGDILLVQGQSNAVSAQYSGDANVNQSPFVRSFGTRIEDGAATVADAAWHQAEGNAAEGKGAVGQWPLRMARALVDARKVPIGILNGARGGKPISYFQRDDANPANPATNYGRLLLRARAAGIDGRVSAILFYQGESDGANAQAHHDGWAALYADWLQDYPSVRRTYVTQIRLGCGNPTVQTLDVQRRLADEFPGVSVMSTTGLDGHDGCHFAYTEGYEELGGRYASLLMRDLFGGTASPDIDAPNPKRAYFSNAGRTELTVEMRDADSTLFWGAGAQAHFAVEGSAVTVTSGSATGANLVLTLSGDGAGAMSLRYAGHTGAGPWVTNAKGVGLLAFEGLPIESK